MGKLAFKFFRVLLIAYIICLVGLFFLQRKFMYLPPADHPRLESTSLENMNEIEFRIDDFNGSLSWWHAPEEGEAVVIFFHGNGSTVYDGRFIYQHLIDEGFGVLGAEYPGYPYSEGKPTQKSLIDAALVQYDYVAAQGVPGERVYLYGTSLGAGVSAQLASQREVGKLVMEAPFNSMMDMVRLRMRIFAIPPLIRDKYESHKALEDLNVPMLWLHGTADPVIPMTEGQKLYDGYGGPKERLILNGVSHNNVWVSGGREAITAFLNR